MAALKKNEKKKKKKTKFVFVDAACKPNGAFHAKAAWKVHFGGQTNDVCNIWVGPLSPMVPKWTNNRSHVQSLLEALLAWLERNDDRHLVVQTCSEYTVRTN
jgi:ribonuclease HI